MASKNQKKLHPIKIVFLAKICVLAFFLAIRLLNIQFGEKNINAANTDLPEQETATKDSPQTTDSDQGSRKSYLEGLLNLPPLNVETAKRDEIGRFLAIAERTKQQAEDRISVLKQRALQLSQLEQKIDTMLKSFDEERKFFSKTLQKEKTLKDERLQNLVNFYGKMEPKKAAPVIEQLDKDLVVALFKKLKQKQVTQILELMAPEKSVAISEYYARIGSAKEYNLLKEMNQSLRTAFNDCKGLPEQAKQ